MSLFVMDAIFVDVAAFPEVSWLPAVLTPGKSILALPLKLTPPMFLAVASIVAVAAFPEVSWLPDVLTPGKSMLALPLKLTPPMFSCCC